jgi:hypothetical protein
MNKVFFILKRRIKIILATKIAWESLAPLLLRTFIYGERMTRTGRASSR